MDLEQILRFLQAQSAPPSTRALTQPVTGTLPADPAYGPVPPPMKPQPARPSMGGYMASPMPPASVPPQAPAPAGLLSAPPSPGAAPPAGPMPPQAPQGLLGAPQPLGPMMGAPQPVSPLVAGGGLPAMPSGGLAPAEAEGGGLAGWLEQHPEVSRGLMEMGMRMMGASAPSLDPKSGSLAYAASQGMGGFMQAGDEVREQKRQERSDAVNEAYKLAIAAGEGGNPAPEVIKVATPDGLGEQALQWNPSSSQWEPIAGAGAKPYKASGAGGAGGPGGPGKWELKTVNGQSMWVNEATQEMRPVTGAGAAAPDEALAEVKRIRGIVESDPNMVGIRGTDLLKGLNYLGTGVGGERYGQQRELEMFVTQRAMELAKSLKGSLSDKDLQFLKDTQPKLSDPPEVWLNWLSGFEDQYLGGRTPAPAPPPGAGGATLKYNPATGLIE